MARILWSTPRSTLGPLPPELVNQVLQYLHDEKRTLSAIAGVNTTWRDLAQPHRFHVLKHGSSTTFDDLFAFLQDRPDLAQHVKTLFLCERIGFARYQIKDTQNCLDTVWVGPPAFDCFAFAALLPTMPKLQSLVLENVSLKTPVPTFLRKAYPVSSLSKLEVRGYSTVGVLQVLQRIVRVDTVTLKDIAIECRKPSRIRLFGKRGAMQLGNIVVAETACDVLESLRLGVALAHITSLTVTIEDIEDVEPFSTLLLQAQYGKLMKLDLDLSKPICNVLDSEIPVSSPWPLIGSAISACSTLQSLRVVLPLLTQFSVDNIAPWLLGDPRVRFLTGILAAPALPKTVERIALGFRWMCSHTGPQLFCEDDMPVVWDLDALDGVLAVRNLPLLGPGSVAVEILDMDECNPQDALILNGVIAEALPSVHSAGLLKIEYY